MHPPLPAERELCSPSATCFQRKLSVALITREGAEHEFLEGRPRIVLQKLTKSAMIFKRSSTVPLEHGHGYHDFVRVPSPLHMEHWSEPPAASFKVRSKSYLRTQAKLPSEPSVFKLLACDLVQVDAPLLSGLCAHPQERLQRALRRQAQTGGRELPAFVFCVNYCLPAGAAGPGYTHWAAYFGADDVAALTDEATPLGRVAKPFFFGDSDQFREDRFKLIPRVVQGNILVRKAVGSKPTILGRKLKQYYIRHPRYLEVVVDIGSDPVADRIVKLALGSARHLVIDMVFLLEGTREEELPERILGGARIQYLDMKSSSLQRPVTGVHSP